jgi:PAS domain S-box-containing protein
MQPESFPNVERATKWLAWRTAAAGGERNAFAASISGIGVHPAESSPTTEGSRVCDFGRLLCSSTAAMTESQQSQEEQARLSELTSATASGISSAESAANTEPSAMARAVHAQETESNHEDPALIHLKRYAITSVAHPILLLDVHGYISYINQPLLDLMGHESMKALLYKPFSDCCKYHTNAYAVLARVRQAGRWEGELELVRANGRPLPLEATALPVMDAAGQFVGTTITLYDASERKLTEAALRESEAHSRIFIENALEGILIYDERYVINYASPPAVRMLGYSHGELIGMRLQEIMEPPTVTGSETLGSGSLGAEFGTYVERQCRRKDGSSLIAEATENVLVVDWNIAGYVVNFRDITSRKKAEANLVLAQRGYLGDLDQIPAFIWSTDASGDLCSLNAAFGRFAQVDPQSPSTDFWEKITHPDDLPGLYKTLDRATADQARFQCNVRLRTPTGEFRLFEAAGRPWTDEAGTFAGHIGCVNEVYIPASGKQ